MRRPLFLLLIPALALGTWLLMGIGNGSGPIAPEAPGGSPAAEIAAPSNPASATEAGTTSPLASDTEQRTALQERATPPPPPAQQETQSASKGVLVRVVDARDQRPLAGAEVWAQSQERFVEADVMALFAGELSMEALLTRDAVHGRADNDGFVRLSAPFESLIVRGRSGRLAGMLEVVPRRDQAILLELSPSPAVRVAVQQADGSPAVRFPLDLLLDGQEFLRVFTDAEGIADVRSALEASRHMFGDGEGELLVRASVPMLDPVELRLDYTSPPSEVPVLKLPPLATLRIEVTGIDPEGPPTVVRLELAPESITPQSILPSPNPMDGLVALAGPDGLVEFPIGLGLVAVAVGWQRWTEQPDYVVLGPANTGGQVLRARLDVSSRSTLGRLRVLHEVAGEPEPLAEQTVGVQVNKGVDVSPNHPQFLRTDSEGYLTVPMDEDSEQGSIEVSLGGQGTELLVGSLTYSARPLAGINPLGDVLLTPAPLLGAGHVRDQAGAPVPNATVVFLASDGMGSRRTATLTDSAGAFAIHGRILAQQLSVFAFRDAPVSEQTPLIVPVGQEDIELVLPTVADLEVELIGDARVLSAIEERRALHLTSRGEQSTVPIRPSRFEASAASDRVVVHFEGVETGLFDLKLLTMDAEQGALWIGRNIAVEPDRTCHAIPIDLHGRVFAHTLRVLDPSGNALDRAKVALCGAESASYPRGEWNMTLPATVLSQSPRVNLWASSPGKPPLDGVEWNAGGEITVRLEPTPQLQVQLPDNLLAQGKGVTFSGAVQVDDTVLDLRRFDEAGRSQLPLTAAARRPGAKVTFELFAVQPGGRSQRLPPATRVLDRFGNTGAEVLVLELSMEELQDIRKAIAELR